MKTINLTKYRFCRRAKKYQVYVGGENPFVEFTQEREAKKFVTKLAKELTESLRLLNECYKNTLYIAQTYYFDFNRRNTIQYNELINSINERMFFILDKFYVLDNSFYLKTIIGISQNILLLIEFVHENTSKIKYTGFDYQFQSISQQVDHIVLRLRQRGNLNPTFMSYSRRNQIELFKTKIA